MGRHLWAVVFHIGRYTARPMRAHVGRGGGGQVDVPARAARQQMHRAGRRCSRHRCHRRGEEGRWRRIEAPPYAQVVCVRLLARRLHHPRRSRVARSESPQQSATRERPEQHLVRVRVRVRVRVGVGVRGEG